MAKKKKGFGTLLGMAAMPWWVIVDIVVKAVTYIVSLIRGGDAGNK